MFRESRDSVRSFPRKVFPRKFCIYYFLHRSIDIATLSVLLMVLESIPLFYHCKTVICCARDEPKLVSLVISQDFPDSFIRWASRYWSGLAGDRSVPWVAAAGGSASWTVPLRRDWKCSSVLKSDSTGPPASLRGGVRHPAW